MHSWTGNRLSTALAADFGPCPEAAGEGRSAGQGVCFLGLSPPSSGLARRGRRRGAQVDEKFAFYASRSQLRAWPGGGAGGAAYETGSLLFIVFGSRPLLRPADNGEGAYGPRVCIPASRATEFEPIKDWLKGLLLRLAHAGPPGDLKNALLRRRLGLPGGSGTGGAPTAAAESHRCWTAAGTYVRAGLYLHTFGRRTRADSTTPSYLAVSGGLAGGCGERGTCAAVSIISLGSCSGGGLAGRTAAAAGSCWTCWRSQECSAPSPSRVFAADCA